MTFRRLITQLLAVLIAVQIPAQCAASRYYLIMNEQLAAKDLRLPEGKSFADVLSPKLSPDYRNYLTLNLFAEADSRIKKAPERMPFLAMHAWKDLELFPHLFDAIDRTTTVFGKATLSGILTDPKPITDITELKRRQAAVKMLRNDAGLRKSLQHLLTQIQKAEEVFLLFHMTNHSERKTILRGFYTPRLSNWSSNPGFYDKMYEAADSSPTVNLSLGAVARLAMFMQFSHMFDTVANVWHWILQPTKDALFGMDATRIKDKARYALNAQADQLARAANEQDIIKDKGMMLGYTEVGGKKVFNGLRGMGHFSKQMQDIILFPLAPWQYYQDMKQMVGVHRVLHSDLIRLAAAVNSLRSASLAMHRLGVANIVPECKALFSLFTHPGQAPEFKKLLDILESNTFKGRASSWSIAGHYGRMFAANHLMDRTKVVWAQLFQSIGYIDAYLSIATLMDEYEAKNVKFCFPEYLEADQPVLELHSFWNPVVTLKTNHDMVVTNDLTFGMDENNIMLTGPNAGGKSTIVRGVGHCIFLAQTLGIAPAASMRFTPFTTLNTAMNLRDSQAEGLSGFKTELNTACRVLTKKVSHLQPKQFAFNLFDELFRATSQQDAQDTLYLFAKKFTKPNMLTLYATHNHGDKIVGLEQEQHGQFSNYKVEAPDGEHPDFKLKRGWTRQSVCKKLWQEFGLVDHQD